MILCKRVKAQFNVNVCDRGMQGKTSHIDRKYFCIPEGRKEK